jgi:hypothetical protein
MGTYIDMLRARTSGEVPFEAFEGAPTRRVSKIKPPPLDSDGVPCGVCPSCGRGEFWRYPKFHPKHDHRGWRCWFCDTIPAGGGPCDFCGVPEG